MNSKSILSAGTHFLTLLGINAFIVFKTLMDLGTQVEYFLKRWSVSVGQ
ncbi:MAG: hypothetical protein HC875_26405 [Anaerolineales bacterium]|nr:hypothetical protein [Anaerolineales bacterium]